MTSDRSSSCLEHETLVALIAGQLELSRHPRIEEHLAECSDCQSIVAAAAAGLESSQGSELGQRGSLPKPGDMLAAKYRLERILGRGAMGTVFAATHGELGQSVAIKVLHSSAPTAPARFLQEAKISAQLRSEHTARVFDRGETSEGAPFIVMEYLAGEDLAKVISRGPLEPHLAVVYAQQICVALSEAHAARVVHRDLKPSNIFVTHRDGRPCLKVLDFGISKRLMQGELEPNHDLTNAHAVLGSPAYMSPEQLRQSKDVDLRSDLWSFGVVLYELLTARRPFEARTLSALSAAIAADIPRPPSALNPAVPAPIDRVVLRCLMKEPKDRFASAAEVADSLRSATLQRARPLRRRWLVPLSVLATAAAAVQQYEDSPAESRQIAAALPLPAPEAPPRQLSVECDLPYPSGSLHFDFPSALHGPDPQRSWPVQALCAGGEGDATRSQLARILAQALPLPRATLDPPHPCYRVQVLESHGGTSLTLARAERCPVQLTWTGPDCARVESIEIRGPGMPPLVVQTPSQKGAPAALGANCQQAVELPFEAYGQSLGFRFTPAEYSSPDVAFTGASLQLSLVRKPPSPRNARARTVCVPPDYCRD